MKKILFVLCAAAATMVACNKAEVAAPVANDDARVVKFETQNLYSFDTKTGSAFAADRHVALYAGSPISSYHQDYTIGTITEHAGTLTGSSIKWGAEQLGTETATNFLALYPYSADDAGQVAFSEASPNLAFNINEDEYASYFMTAFKSQAPGTNAASPNSVALAFTHPFVKLSYSITSPADDAISEVKMYNVKRTGNIAFTTGAATATGDVIAEGSAYAVSGSDGSYWTIIMPGSCNPTLQVIMRSGLKYEYKLADNQVFEAGKNYTASMTISNHSAAVTSRTPITATFTEADWNNQTYSPSGNESGDWYYVAGTVGTNKDWSEDLPMANVGNDTWRLVVDYDSTPGNKGIKIKKNKSWDYAYGYSDAITYSGDASTNGSQGYFELTNIAGDSYNIKLGESGTYTIFYFTGASNGTYGKMKVMKGSHEVNEL